MEGYSKFLFWWIWRPGIPSKLQLQCFKINKNLPLFYREILEYFNAVKKNTLQTGGDNSNKACFGRTT